MKTIEDYIYVENHIPVEICESLVDECNKKEWKKHTWNNYMTGTESSESTKELDVMACTQEQQNKITPYLVKALEEYQIKYSWPGEKTQPPWLSKFSPIRFNKYSTGTIMRKHYDHIHSIFDGERKGIPILTVLGLLNDDYEGGQFKIRNKIHKVRQGSFIIFPSCYVYPHQVKEVTKGTRYSFVSWGY